MDCKQTDVKWSHRVDDRSHSPRTCHPRARRVHSQAVTRYPLPTSLLPRAAQLSLASLPGRQIEYCSFGWTKGGNVSSAGWQATPCDAVCGMRVGVAARRVADCYALRDYVQLIAQSTIHNPHTAPDPSLLPPAHTHNSPRSDGKIDSNRIEITIFDSVQCAPSYTDCSKLSVRLELVTKLINTQTLFIV